MKNKNYVIIGPSKAGKTMLLATLNHAILSRTSNENGFKIVRMQNLNDNMEKLQNSFHTVVSGRYAVANASIVEYSFELFTQRKVFGVFTSSKTTKFLAVDGPGGALFPIDGHDDNASESIMTEYRKKIISLLSDADGILICIDSTDEQPIHSIFKHLPELLRQAADMNANNRLKLEKICLCLTKADMFFSDCGANARHTMKDKIPPDSYITNLMTRQAFNAIKNTISPKAVIAFGWSSIFGFQSDGSVNEEFLEQNQISISDYNDWVPYGVMDPFLFLSTNEQINLSVILAKNLNIE